MANKYCGNHDPKVKMNENKNGTYKCPTCGGVFIPEDWTGEFTTDSIIGINQKKPSAR